MYMKDTFGHRLLENITVNRSIEAPWCEIIIDNKKNDEVIIGLCYDSPGNDEEKSNMLYGDIYKAVGRKDCIVIIIGRFYYDKSTKTLYKYSHDRLEIKDIRCIHQGIERERKKRMAAILIR